jgi:hypothetical protein
MSIHWVDPEKQYTRRLRHVWVWLTRELEPKFKYEVKMESHFSTPMWGSVNHNKSEGRVIVFCYVGGPQQILITSDICALVLSFFNKTWAEQVQLDKSWSGQDGHLGHKIYRSSHSEFCLEFVIYLILVLALFWTLVWAPALLSWSHVLEVISFISGSAECL